MNNNRDDDRQSGLSSGELVVAGSLLDMVPGALAGAGVVTLCYQARSPHGAGSFVVVGDWPRDVILGGTIGSIVFAGVGGLVAQWLSRRSSS